MDDKNVSKSSSTAQLPPSQTIVSPPTASTYVELLTLTAEGSQSRKDSKVIDKDDKLPTVSKGKQKALKEENVNGIAEVSHPRDTRWPASGHNSASTACNIPPSAQSSAPSQPFSYYSYHTIPLDSNVYGNVPLGRLDLSSVPSIQGFNPITSPASHPVHFQWDQYPSQSSSRLYGQLPYFLPPLSPSGGLGQSLNRKLMLARRNQGRRTLPSSSEQPVNRAPPNAPKDINYDIFAVDEIGTELFGLCKAVPYLIGPRRLLDSLVSLRDHVQNLREDIAMDEDGVHIIEPARMSFMDKALLLVLWLLSKPKEETNEHIKKLLTRFETEERKLIIFKNMGEKRLPERITIALFDFGNMVIEWEENGNPCNIAADREDAVTPWVKVLPYIKKRKIPTKYITKAEYDEWIMLPESELEERIRHFICNGELEKKKQVEEQRDISSRITVKPGVLGNTFHFTLPNPTDPLEWGAKRFSHENPFGKLVDYTKGRHDNALLPEERAKDQAKLLQQRTAPQPTGINCFLHTVKPKKSWFRTWPCWLMCLIIIGAVSTGFYFLTTHVDVGVVRAS